MSEFSLIQRYFTRATPGAILGVGDDAALVRVASGMELAISTDMLVSGTHFFPDTDPFMLGHKTLAVNLSDMAAMGAQPRWATLALSLPAEDAAWLEKFSAGFFALADQFQVELIGGDTTRGPLNLCVTIMGEVPEGKAIRRDGARVGDEVWVSGTLGKAALVLAHMQGKVTLSEAELRDAAPALHRPQPRIEVGIALRGLATSAIDISDGLVADLGHILERSRVAAEFQYSALPTGMLKEVDMPLALRQYCVLAGGDDYELCFTAPANKREELTRLSTSLSLPLTCIGKISTGSGCKVYAENGSVLNIVESGYEHF